MKKSEWGSLLKRNNDKKPINPIALFFAFIVGAVAAFAAAWRIKGSKESKNAGSGRSEERFSRNAETDG